MLGDISHIRVEWRHRIVRPSNIKLKRCDNFAMKLNSTAMQFYILSDIQLYFCMNS